jgi:hypothetical protein
MDDDVVWMDDAGGRLVRPYSVIRGRTRPTQRDLDLFLIVSVAEGTFSPQVPDREYTRILDLCRKPLSIAEVAAYSGLPMAVAKVIISDLLDNGYLVAGASAPQRDRELLMLVLEGLKRL